MAFDRDAFLKSLLSNSRGIWQREFDGKKDLAIALADALETYVEEALAAIPAATGVVVGYKRENFKVAIANNPSTTIPADATIPVITEGDEYMDIQYTPSDATNRLLIRAHAIIYNGSASRRICTGFIHIAAGDVIGAA